MDVPQESCDLNPQEFCRHQRRLVPHLEPVEECRPQPKEICTLNFSSPKLAPRDEFSPNRQLRYFICIIEFRAVLNFGIFFSKIIPL